MSTRRFGFSLVTLVLVTVTGAGVAPAASLAPVTVRPTQELVAVLSARDAFSRPTSTSARIERVTALRPLTAERTVLPVLGHSAGADGMKWVRVRLPGRPNSHTGWIRQRGLVTSTTPWHIEVATSSRRVLVFKNGHVVRTFRVVVGKPSTPTPRGEFFVEEAIALESAAAGAPFALALSARSNVLQEFAGGPGQIALHGLSNVGGVPGTAASHGCVRLDNEAMRWLVLRIGPGTPVTITA